MKNALERGQTYYGTSATIDTAAYGGIELEGMEVAFMDTSGTGSRMSRGRIMRNVSDVTLYGGRTAKHIAGITRHRRFDGYGVTTAGTPVAGIIDPALVTTGVRKGDLCIVFYEGPCKCLLNENPGEVVAVGDWAIAMTGVTSQAALTGAGKLLLLAGAGTTPPITNLGVFMEAATTLECTGATMKYVDLNIVV